MLTLVVGSSGATAQDSPAQDSPSSTRNTAAYPPGPAEPPSLREEVPGHWMLYGVSLGALLEDDTTYATIGIEISYAHVRPSLLAWGAFVEARYDQGARGLGLALGLQVGYALFVIDAGPYVRLGERSALGFRARGCLAVVGALSFCGGAAALTSGERFGEVTLLLKYPRRARE
jgi:hypothetical protein